MNKKTIVILGAVLVLLLVVALVTTKKKAPATSDNTPVEEKFDVYSFNAEVVSSTGWDLEVKYLVAVVTGGVAEPKYQTVMVRTADSTSIRLGATELPSGQPNLKAGQKITIYTTDSYKTAQSITAQRIDIQQ